jgi:hypothetical protein
MLRRGEREREREKSDSILLSNPIEKGFPFPEVLDMAPFMETAGAGPILYELFGVVIHRGDQASHGHYHAYLHDVLNESKAVGSNVLASEDEPEFAGWFDFNDSQVRPVSLATVRTQYGGAANRAECAYMLIYRQKNCPLLSEVSDVPALPPQLAAEIAAENAEIQRKRAEWEEMKNKIEIVLHVPTMLELGIGETIRIAGKVCGEDFVRSFLSAYLFFSFFFFGKGKGRRRRRGRGR